jgi:Zn-dependent protease with chaperone function
MSTEQLKAVIAHECAHILNKESQYGLLLSPIVVGIYSIFKHVAGLFIELDEMKSI